MCVQAAATRAGPALCRNGCSRVRCSAPVDQVSCSEGQRHIPALLSQATPASLIRRGLRGDIVAVQWCVQQLPGLTAPCVLLTGEWKDASG